MFYWICYYIFRFISKVFLPITIFGAENLPKDTAYILASNHLSYMDPIIVGLSQKCKISYMARDNLFRNKVFALILRQGQAFPVKRNTADIGALKEAIKRLKGGSPLLLFPQGSRSAVSGKDSLESGVGFLAVKSGVPIVPVKITGSDKVLPPGAKWVKKHPVTVFLGKPMYFTKEDGYPEIAQKVMSQIKELSS